MKTTYAQAIEDNIGAAQLAAGLMDHLAQDEADYQTVYDAFTAIGSGFIEIHVSLGFIAACADLDLTEAWQTGDREYLVDLGDIAIWYLDWINDHPVGDEEHSVPDSPEKAVVCWEWIKAKLYEAEY